MIAMLLCIGIAVYTQEASQEPVDESTPIAVDETELLIGESEPEVEAAVSPFSIWDLVRMIVVLAVVIGAIYMLFYLLRRAGGNRQAQSAMIRVLGSQSLPGNRTLYLVEVGGQVFLIGAGGESINLISEIEDKETIDRLVLSVGDGAQAQRRTFAEMIGGMFSGGATGGGANSGSIDFMRRQRERLSKLHGGSDA